MVKEYGYEAGDTCYVYRPARCRLCGGRMKVKKTKQLTETVMVRSLKCVNDACGWTVKAIEDTGKGGEAA